MSIQDLTADGRSASGGPGEQLCLPARDVRVGDRLVFGDVTRDAISRIRRNRVHELVFHYGTRQAARSDDEMVTVLRTITDPDLDYHAWCEVHREHHGICAEGDDRDAAVDEDTREMSAVPLEEALAPYAARAARRKAHDDAAAKRRELHDRIIAETHDMYAALDAQIEAGGIGDTMAAALAERRFVRGQLVLSHLCGTLSAYYREGSTTHAVLGLAAAALGWASWRTPELRTEIGAVLAAERAAEKARVPA